MKIFIAVLVSFFPTVSFAQISAKGDIKAKNVVSGNNNKISSTTINKKTTVNNITYNIYYGSNLSLEDKEKLASTVDPHLRERNGKPTILVIPKVLQGHDIYAALNDPVFRSGLSTVRQAFLDKGYSLIPYPDQNIITRQKLPGKKVDSKSMGVFLSGADICVEMDIIKRSEGGESYVEVIMSAYNRDNGNLISEKSERSNAFQTDDYTLLLENVVPLLVSDFVKELEVIKK